MAAVSSNVKLFMVVVVLVLASASTATAAVQCNTVFGKLAPCLAYVSGTGRGAPPSGCCSGIKGLYSSLKGTADRQATCRCLKSLATQYAGVIKLGVVKTLPSKCGLSLPYVISPAINCNSVR